MESQIKRRKVLLLRGQSSGGDDVAAMMGGQFDVTIVGSVEEAMVKIQEGGYDAVFSQISDFLPLERAVVSQQAVGILNTIGEGVCITDEAGLVVWENERMRGFENLVRDGVSERSRQAYEQFSKQFGADPVAKGAPLKIRPRKYSFTDPETSRYFEMITTPMLDSGGHVTQLATVVWEATASRVLQQRINAIDKAGSELVRLEAEAIAGMTVEQRINVVQDKIIRYAKQLLHFDNFVVRILNRTSNQLEVLFGVGLPEDDGMEIFANSENNGITGYVAATGRSYICNNTAGDPRYLPGLANALSTLTVPLRLHDKVIGTLNVESSKASAFDEDDRQMAEIFGRYIAVAMNILDLLVVERYKTTGQAADQLSRQVSEPLNAIVTEASLLMEEYIGHDDLRNRLGAIIDHTTQIKRALKDVQSGPKGILGARTMDPVVRDPLLSGKRVLVVDDEKYIRETISDVLGRYDCIVDSVRDGKEAIALLGSQSYDLLISDIKLPCASGYEVFSAARERDMSIAVILMTGFGYDPNHSIVRANREGLNAVLYKPFKVNQLMEEVKQALLRRQGAQ